MKWLLMAAGLLPAMLSLKFVIMMILKVSQLRIYTHCQELNPQATELYVTKKARKIWTTS
ncbi:ASN_collapsed_G0048070.mRNA.1.CDS.1 [Saccharomyces cerevisiae]|nr:ASN_collapsed_G0048070.mRNA.1.CDS.1 [Saccharomyces cerevisiae]